jgi:hypothetical protein
MFGRYNRIFSKHSASWVAYERKVPKEYSYMSQLLNSVIQNINSSLLHSKKALHSDDPRQKCNNIAPVPAPETHTIVATKKSRLH